MGKLNDTKVTGNLDVTENLKVDGNLEAAGNIIGNTVYGGNRSCIFTDGVMTFDSSWSKFVHVGNDMDLSNLSVYVHGLS